LENRTIAIIEEMRRREAARRFSLQEAAGGQSRGDDRHAGGGAAVKIPRKNQRSEFPVDKRTKLDTIPDKMATGARVDVGVS
jgi:hypothetical protein